MPGTRVGWETRKMRFAKLGVFFGLFVSNRLIEGFEGGVDRSMTEWGWGTGLADEKYRLDMS